MSGWRYLLVKMTGDGSMGQILHPELPLSNVSITRNLTATDEITATVSPALASLKQTDGRPIFDEWGCAIFAEADGDIRAGAIVNSSKAKGPDWSLQCVGFSGYPYGMPYTGSWSGVQIDPLDAFREAWRHLQDAPEGDLGLEIPLTKTGLKIGTVLTQVQFDTQSGPVSFEAGPVKLNWYETHDLGPWIADLAKDTPFDYREKHWWDGDVIRHALELGYPRLGRRLTDMRFVLGENILQSPDVDRDGSKYASEILVLGAGSGRTMIKGSAYQKTGKLRRAMVAEEKQLRSLSSANTRAQALLKGSLISGDVTSIVVSNHAHAPISAISPGDEIYVHLSDDWQDLSIWCRVLSIQLQPDDTDDATLTVVRSDKVS